METSGTRRCTVTARTSATFFRHHTVCRWCCDAANRLMRAYRRQQLRVQGRLDSGGVRGGAGGAPRGRPRFLGGSVLPEGQGPSCDPGSAPAGPGGTGGTAALPRPLPRPRPLPSPLQAPPGAVRKPVLLQQCNEKLAVRNLAEPEASIRALPWPRGCLWLLQAFTELMQLQQPPDFGRHAKMYRIPASTTRMTDRRRPLWSK